MDFIIQIDTLNSIAERLQKMLGTTKRLTVEEFITALDTIKESYINYYHATGDLVIPEGVETIHGYMFKNVQTLTSVKFPSTLKTIGPFAFDDCDGISSLIIPSSVETISDRAFGYISSNNVGPLRLVTFEGTPKSISANAFEACYELATINVSWAEGAVEGAPWGAANATINYKPEGGWT